ncbi:MAG: TetR/AcrR family transcriptional regulator [Pseudomonadota bacterium]
MTVADVIAKPTPQRRYKPAETRAHILFAAQELFRAQGYMQTSSAEIAERAGVAEGSVFYHYGSKQNLLTAMGEAHAEEMVAAMHRGETDLGRLEPGILIARAFDYAQRNGIAEECTGLPMASPEVQPFMNASRAVIVEFIARCIRASAQRHCDMGIDRAATSAQATIAASFSYAVVSDALHHLHTSTEPVDETTLLGETIRYVRAACGYSHLSGIPALETPEEIAP